MTWLSRDCKKGISLHMPICKVVFDPSCNDPFSQTDYQNEIFADCACVISFENGST